MAGQHNKSAAQGGHAASPDQPTLQTRPVPQNHHDGGRRPGSQGPRVVAAVLATVVIAFCVWAMSQYAQGSDPLAWITSQPALQTTQEASSQGSNGSSSNSAAADASGGAASASFTKDDVTSAIGTLTWNGQDVSCQASDIRVVLKEDAGIWVEQASRDSSQAMVDRTAERLAALSAWVRQNGVDAPHVTWITEDGNGYIRLIVRAAPEAMGSDGSAADLLGSAEAYVICYGDYTSALKSAGVAQTKGDTPVYPDGNKASVATTKAQSEEQERQTAEAKAKSSSQRDNAGSNSSSNANSADGSQAKNGSGPGAPAGGDSSSDDGGSGRPSAATVSVSVNGSAAGGGSHGTSVGFHDGMTAYDALVAADGSVNARGTAYGMYVAAIDGLAEKQHGAMSGWVYAVNGVEPNTACSNYKLNPGDTVTWTYVNVES